MQESNLVIVESPAKAKTIEKFLGKDFLVKSSFGHIRDLSKKDFGVDIKNGFKPEYIISPDKEAVVRELKKLSKKAETVWLASDEDREGEAIAWHLKEALELSEDKINRIVFHEITKDAIINAVKNPRKIDTNLVEAQQARRILDRLVGFEVSPILWKKVKPSLSAGRVQSVAVRLVVEREREIINFKSVPFFKVVAEFSSQTSKEKIKAELNERFNTKEEAVNFLKTCINTEFVVEAVEKKPVRRSPSAPFTTSTLQQEASRKLGFSVKQTMSVAQRLYENGFITYMRTDSTNLSGLAINTAKATIIKNYGEKYSQVRQYKTKQKGAQEAHEAIRPTFMDNQTVEGSAQEQRLYELIWKRTLASQMSDAALEKTVININMPGIKQKFQAVGEVLLFDGFLKVYMESTDDDAEDNKEASSLLPPVKVGEKLSYINITATERFSQRPARYSEASLVKKMEELGIGRPSTYAPTISTIMQREYVTKEDREGVERKYSQISLEKGNLQDVTKKEITGADRARLFPSDIGILVNDFLVEHFKNIVDYNFTATIEEQFDEIASGNMKWDKMIESFYTPFHSDVEKSEDVSRPASIERVLGIDPKTGGTISVRLGRYGPLAQIVVEGEEKPKFASLQRGMLLETITLEESLRLFDLPRVVGEYEGKELTAAIGRFGPYIKMGSEFISLKKEDNPYTVTEIRAIELIEEKRKRDKERLIKDFGEVQVLNGRWGPFIKQAKDNFKIPKTLQANELTLEDCLKLIEEQGKTSTKKKPAKSIAKKTAAKKVVTKKAVAKPAAKKTTKKK